MENNKSMPQPLCFYEDEDGKTQVYLYGIIDLEWLLLCRGALNDLLDNKLSVEYVANHNAELLKKRYERDILRKEIEEDLKKYIPEYVYVIESNKKHKIGRTLKPKGRLKKYITENPNKINVILLEEVNDCIKTESELLRKFKDKNIHGEWFDLDEKDLKEIKQYLKDK